MSPLVQPVVPLALVASMIGHRISGPRATCICITKVTQCKAPNKLLFMMAKKLLTRQRRTCHNDVTEETKIHQKSGVARAFAWQNLVVNIGNN